MIADRDRHAGFADHRARPSCRGRRPRVRPAVALALALALLATAGIAAAQRIRLDRSSCFLYSPALDGYACVDFALQSDDVGRRDPVRAPDVTRWVQGEPAAWGGHRGIALVRGDSNDLDDVVMLAVAEREYGRNERLRRPRTLAQALAQARRTGYTRPVTERAELVPGRWIPFAGVHLRFETHIHEGDASAYAIGSLYSRCAPPPPGASVEGSTELLGSGLDRRGDRAVAFHAAGAPSFAVTLREVDGAEGAGGVRTRTVVVRRERVCPSP